MADPFFKPGNADKGKIDNLSELGRERGEQPLGITVRTDGLGNAKEGFVFLCQSGFRQRLR